MEDWDLATAMAAAKNSKLLHLRLFWLLSVAMLSMLTMVRCGIWATGVTAGRVRLYHLPTPTTLRLILQRSTHQTTTTVGTVSPSAEVLAGFGADLGEKPLLTVAGAIIYRCCWNEKWHTAYTSGLVLLENKKCAECGF